MHPLDRLTAPFTTAIVCSVLGGFAMFRIWCDMLAVMYPPPEALRGE